MLQDMISWEKRLWEKGVRLVAGIDEVGKGPLAGPLVVCSVILDLEKVILMNENHKEFKIYSQIRDSKKLTDKRRREVRDFLVNEVIDYSIVEISHESIDKRGISNAVQTAFFESVKSLKTKPEHILTDFVHIKNITEKDQSNIIAGDNVSVFVAAASIIAKVYRDNIMIDMHNKYPKYYFHKHKGYGTKQHIRTMKEHGPCEIHRKSFEPLKSMLES